MSEFTSGKWEVEGTVPFGIKSEASPRIAIVLTPEDARLIAAAPEMYRLLKAVANYKPNFVWDVVFNAQELLARIDGEEAKYE